MQFCLKLAGNGGQSLDPETVAITFQRKNTPVAIQLAINNMRK